MTLVSRRMLCLQIALGPISSHQSLMRRALSLTGQSSALEEPLLRGAFSDGGDSRGDVSPRSEPGSV